MAKEYLMVDGKLVKADTKLVQVPDTENLNDLADENGAYATQSEEVANEIEELIVKNGVIDGSPKGVYANLSALQTAYPSGASGVYLTSDNGHWYYWNGSAWTDGGVYQSSEDVKQIKEDLVNESNKITTDHFDIFGDSDFIEHEGLLVGYDTTTYDADISTASEKYMVYRTLEIAIKNLASLKIKCPLETNIGMTFFATDLTTTMPSKTSDTSATPSQINGNYSKKYISHVSSDEYYLVNTKALFEDGYKKMYVCYLATERPYIYCEKNLVPKWLYDFSKDISELRKIVEGGDTEESETIYDVMNPSIYNMIYQKDTSTIFQDGKNYSLKIVIAEPVTNGSITLNSAGSASSKFKVFLENSALSVGEHIFSFTFDGSIQTQYLRLYLDGASSKCTKFEIIDPNVAIQTRLDRKMDYTIATVNMFNSIGAIGDSYTAGSTKHSDGTWTKELEHSYIATMAKRAGINWSNYGVPGASTRTYLSGVDGDVGMNNVLNADANDFYFLALGINDVGMLGLDYLGTISDITSSYTSNPDTFFGNYARIIERTMEHAPKAKFCMVKPPFKSGNYPAFREAIEQIANHYGIPFIDLLDDPAMSASAFLTMSDGHPTLAGYSAMGLAYERLFSKMVEKNVEYFRYATVG